MSHFYKRMLLAALFASGAVCAEQASAQSQLQTFSTRVATGNDDVEEASSGSMDFSSSDLELVDDPGDNGTNQVIGIRFINITIPANAYITKAYLQFSVDEPQHTGATNLLIKGHALDNAPVFANTSQGVSSRAKTTASVNWAPVSWPTANMAGPDQATPDLKSIIQEIVNRSGWQSGNALSFEITGTGRRNVHAYNGRPADAPQLVVEYRVPSQMRVKISASSDDAEERGLNATSGAGTIDLTSSDIELVNDGNDGDQFVGLRFQNIAIPKSAIITNAYLQFTQDEFPNDVMDNQPAQISIKGEAVNNAATFTTASTNISSRPTTTASVNWTINPIWNVQNEAGVNQRTPDLTAIINEIKQRAGWQAGNAINLLITGTGRRFAQSWDKDPTKAAELVIDYVTTQPAPGPFPVAKNTVWLYNDKGTDLGTSWKDIAYDDSGWDYGAGILGYGDASATTLSFGPNSSNKYPTYYFRHKFNVTDASQIDSLLFDVVRDDGVVVYLNGVEQFRTNMPTGAITYNTWAPAIVDGADERTYFRDRIKNTNLVSGLNILAVEIHQNRNNSSDISFDLNLTPVMKPVKTDTAIVATGGTWKYLDTGSDQGTNWVSPTFDDTNWASGDAVLGYGNGDETTTLSFGADATNKNITTYFRKTFTVTDTAGFNALELNLIRDDAAVVYLNGTEVLRSNLMAGTLNYQATAIQFVEGDDETKPVIAYINKKLLNQGTNTLAVEVHKFNAMETDLRFDLGLRLVVDSKPVTPVTAYIDCNPVTSDAIGCFTSVKPTTQTQSIVFPNETHTFQQIAKSGVTKYTGTNQTLPGNHDFTGYIGINGSSKQGFLSINHENSPGGVSMLSLHLNEASMTWEVDSVRKVDFGPVQSTIRNCSGGLTPWGTIITSEENTSGGDANNDGYQDIGWQVEIDPVTAQVIDHDNDGSPDKLWAIGRMNHENIAVGADSVTVYQAEDGGSSAVYKFVADQKGNLSAGTLYALQRSTTDPTTGTWIQIPNTTAADRNNTKTLAISLGATNWSNPEDIEFGPDGKIYFACKGSGTIWRFKDDGSTVSQVEAWVTNRSYPISHTDGVQNENFGTGIDNLTFDGEGNLWALQDGGRNHLWVIRPDHTPANPHVELFLSTPAGSEPTGLTFSPDFRYGFISMQHPSGANTTVLKDAAGNNIRFNSDVTFVFARKENLGSGAVEPTFELGSDLVLCQGDSVQLKAYSGTDALVRWTGNIADSVLTVKASGVYTATAFANNGKEFTDSIRVTVAQMPVADLGASQQQVCGGSLLLDAGNAGSGMNYLWSDGSVAQTLNVTTSGRYYVTVTNPVAGCVATDTVDVIIHPQVTVNLGNDVKQCGGMVMLDAGNAGMNYLWSDGSVSQTLSATTSGQYFVRVTNPATGCENSDTVQVAINALPLASMPATFSACAGNTVSLDAGNAGMQYAWSTGATTQTISTATAGKYFVTITNPATGCQVQDSTDVLIYSLPAVSLGNDTTICNSCNITLDAGTGFNTYVWNNGATGQTITVNSSGAYFVTVTDANGCSVTDTIQVTKITGIKNAVSLDKLIDVYPNPFRSSTQIKLNLPESAHVEMDIYDMTGKKIETLVNSKLLTGEHSYTFTPAKAQAAQGVYLVRIVVNNRLNTKKLIHLNE